MRSLRPASLPQAAACLALLLLVAVLRGPGEAGASPPETFEQLLERHEQGTRRPSFRKRIEAREALAQTGDVRALQVLVKDYDKPEAPEDHVRYTLVSLAAKELGAQAAHRPVWEGWRARYAKPEHLLLWLRATEVEAGLGGSEALALLGQAKADPVLRTAVLRGWAEAPRERVPASPTAAEAALTVLGALPATGVGRNQLVEAVARVLATLPAEPREPRLALAERLLEPLSDKAITPRTRLVVARCLAAALGADRPDLDPALWKREIEAARAGAAPTPPEADAYAGPRFVGLPAAGKRIVYVIDASDSMLAPIESAERQALERPVTGEGGRPATPDDLPWDRIKTRFDAARESLKASLARLDKERSFCVVLFGDEARLLKATPGLKPATPAAIKAAIKELDAIERADTKPTAEFPHGQLRGGTNLHGGLLLAFRTGSKGPVEEGEHLEPRLLEEGCDTVFVLSDGVPSWDDFWGTDVPDPEDTFGNPETGAEGERGLTTQYYGPYGPDHAVGDYLVQDLRRMNLLRNAEIHCVAVGEADDTLLARIAAEGLGKVRRIGAAR
ncbi:MAG: vWA domain-containing protein [Planctomycetia bacterium]